MHDFWKYCGEKVLVVLRILTSILFDAVLFVGWLFIAWGAQLIEEFLKERGVHEWAAFTFKWASSIGTLALTLLYIIHDLLEVFRTLFCHNTSRMN